MLTYQEYVVMPYEQYYWDPAPIGPPGVVDGTITPFGVIGGDALYSKPTWFNKGEWPFHYSYPDITMSDDDLKKLSYSPILIDLIDSDNQGKYHRVYGC